MSLIQTLLSELSTRKHSNENRKDFTPAPAITRSPNFLGRVAIFPEISQDKFPQQSLNLSKFEKFVKFLSFVDIRGFFAATVVQSPANARGPGDEPATG